MTRKHTEIEKERNPKTCDLCEIEVNCARELKQHLTIHSYKEYIINSIIN